MTTRNRQVPIAKPSLGEEEWLALREPIESGWLTQGPKVAEFEEAFAARHGVQHALATTSCTAALHLGLLALGVGPGDEVIVPAFTWIASANAVIYCGATPVLVDVDPTTFNVRADAVAAAMTGRTKAIMPVHLFGLCADMDAIRDAAPGIPLIEDAACAAGGAYRGQPAGSLGDLGCFSFHPRKSITTGEGGMVTTDDAALADAINRMRNHGASVPEEVRHHGPRPHILPSFEELGFNYRMTDLQAAVGIVQLGKLDRFIDERAQWAAWYRHRLTKLDWLQTPQEPQDGRHAWQAFVCRVGEAAPIERNELMDELQARGVSSRPGTHAVHLQELYANRYGLAPDEFAGARDAHERTMALPLHNMMTEEDYEHVAASLFDIGG